MCKFQAAKAATELQKQADALKEKENQLAAERADIDKRLQLLQVISNLLIYSTIQFIILLSHEPLYHTGVQYACWYFQ